MKSISNFIIEKLKITTDTKIKKSNIQDLYYIVHPKPSTPIFDVIMKYFSDSFVHNDEGGYYFILSKDEAEKCKHNMFVDFYKIPNKYIDLETLEDDFIKLKITLKDMESINL